MNEIIRSTAEAIFAACNAEFGNGAQVWDGEVVVLASIAVDDVQVWIPITTTDYTSQWSGYATLRDGEIRTAESLDEMYE